MSGYHVWSFPPCALYSLIATLYNSTSHPPLCNGHLAPISNFSFILAGAGARCDYWGPLARGTLNSIGQGAKA